MPNLTSEGNEVRIAFLGESLIGWTGGVDFLRLCISGLSSTVSVGEWDVLIPKHTLTQRMRSVAGSIKRQLLALTTKGEKSRYSPVSIAELQDAMNHIEGTVEIIPYRNSRAGLIRVLSRRKSEVLFPCQLSLGRKFPVAWVGYIPDLQHKRLPHFFSRSECLLRDRLFSKVLADACAIVVNARTVVDDIEEFYPNHQARLFALPFCPPINPVFSDESVDVGRTDNLPDKYFLISNQFWIHKSYETAFAALRLVQDAGRDVHILCTGNTTDYRWPGYFDKLKTWIAKNHLQEKVRFLGVVPKRDQLAMMRQSVALIQPTLFEGGPGGGAVYDAVSTCTPAIVSDIDVNREIDIGVIEFFRAGSAEDLAKKMLEFLNDPPIRMGKIEALEILSQRRREFGARLLDVANFARDSRVPIAEVRK
ncbi:MAG: glycosyltransferase [Acidobacteriaceae bacterium]